MRCPFARPLAVEQRGANAPRYGDAGGVVGYRRGGDEARHAVLYLALSRHKPGHCLNYQIVAGTVAVRSAASERGVIAVDEARVDGGQRFVVYAQLGGNVRAGVDDHRVNVGNHLVDYRHALRRRHIERQAALAAIQRHIGLGLFGDELERKPPRFAFERLYLDDVGAHVGEQHPPEGAGDYLGEL